MYMSQMDVPPNLSVQDYLKAYGEIGWLFGAVSLISNAVADVDWRLQKYRGKDWEDVDGFHPLMNMLDRVNPYQTRYQFFELLQMYIGLVGEAFIVLNYNNLRIPAEMWLAPPQYMNIVAGKEEYISHYTLGSGEGKIPLYKEEVIHIKSPNPYNTYRGLGTAQSIGTDLGSEKYAASYQQRVFFNDGVPSLILEVPDTPAPSERKLQQEEWDRRHSGWRNARKTGFLYGGAKANSVAMSNKDMDFTELRRVTRDNILGAYHIPASLMGVNEVGSYAKAKAEQYMFAYYTVKPALKRIQESLNEQLVPIYDKGLRLVFNNPVPDDREAKTKEANELVKTGVISREEAREALGYEPIPPSGSTFLMPFNVIPTAEKQLLQSKVKYSFSEDQKQSIVRDFQARTEAEEAMFRRIFRSLMEEQADEVIANVKENPTVEGAMFNSHENDDKFTEGFGKVIRQIYENAAENATEQVARSLHNAVNKDIPPIMDEFALLWIKTRSLALAKMMNGTTKEQLRKVLAKYFEENRSIPEITKGIKQFYKDTVKGRAAMVARTETIAAANEGRVQTYEKEGVRKVQFVSAMDEATLASGCMCPDLHNQSIDNPVPIKDSHGIIPVHPNCRCTWIPVVD